MTQVMEKICKLRDIVTCKQDNKLIYHHGTINKLKEELKRHFIKKVENPSYELDFTSQDLRELAKDIRSMFKRWDMIMNPEKNIKSIHKTDLIGEKITLHPHFEKVMPIINARRDNVLIFTNLLSQIEHYAVVLYYWEIASNDEFAINFTERLI